MKDRWMNLSLNNCQRWGWIFKRSNWYSCIALPTSVRLQEETQWKARALYDRWRRDTMTLNTIANGISLREIGRGVVLHPQASIRTPLQVLLLWYIVWKMKQTVDLKFTILLVKIVATYHLDWKANQFEFSSLQLRNGVYNYKVISNQIHS